MLRCSVTPGTRATLVVQAYSIRSCRPT